MVHVSDFRAILTREFLRRQSKNPSFSQAAFAKLIKTSPQKLSQILSGKHGLSLKAAADIAQRLKLSNLETELFLALVASKHSRSSVIRNQAKQKADRLIKDFDFQAIDSTAFGGISKWYHWAAYMLVDLKGFKVNMEWVSKKLEISVEQAIAAYEALFAAGLLTKDKDGKWLRTSKRFAFSTSVPIKGIRDLHKEMILKGLHALENSSIETRHFNTTVLSIRAADYNWIKSQVDEFAKHLISDLSHEQGELDCVYGMSIQLFPIARTSNSD